MLISPNEGLQQLSHHVERTGHISVGMLISPNEGLQQQDQSDNPIRDEVGMLISPNEGLQHRYEPTFQIALPIGRNAH